MNLRKTPTGPLLPGTVVGLENIRKIVTGCERNDAVPGDISRACGKDGAMSLLGWALIFLVVAIIAAAFGFGGIASASAGIAKVLFLVFLVVFVVLLIMGLVGSPA